MCPDHLLGRPQGEEGRVLLVGALQALKACQVLAQEGLALGATLLAHTIFASQGFAVASEGLAPLGWVGLHDLELGAKHFGPAKPRQDGASAKQGHVTVGAAFGSHHDVGFQGHKGGPVIHDGLAGQRGKGQAAGVVAAGLAAHVERGHQGGATRPCVDGHKGRRDQARVDADDANAAHRATALALTDTSKVSTP